MLIYMLDLTAVIYVSGILIHEKLDAIGFTGKEVDGAAYTEAVRAPLMAALRGEPLSPGLEAALAQVRRAQDERLKASDQAESFQHELTHVAALAGERSGLPQPELGRRARELLTTVANQSNLILDPDLDSYYVMSLVSLRYPELLQILHEAQATASAARAGAGRQVELLTVAGRLAAVVQGIESDLLQARKAGDAQLDRALSPRHQALMAAVKAHEAQLQALADTPAADAAARQVLADGFAASQAALETAWHEGLGELQRLLERRVDGLYHRMAVHLGTAGALLMAILSLVYLVASQIARPLRGLADVAEAVRQTSDYSRRAEWHSRDEIGRLFTAFNDMLAQLDRDRLVQQELTATARAAEAQKALLEASPIPLMVTSVPDHRILHLNEPARPWLGDLTQDPWRQSLEPGVRGRFFQRLADRDVVDEFEVRWRGGAEPAWAVLSARRLVFQGQDAVLTAFTPINVLKVMEQRLELWAKVFEASSEGITIMDAQRRIVSVNAAFCRSTGYEFYEVVGEELDRLIDGPGPAWDDINEAWQGEVRLRRQSGDAYPAWLMVSAVREGGSSGPMHYIGIAIDITDRKAKEERIRFLAQHDVLTELPNRALCQIRLGEALAEAQRSGEQLAVLFIDLDRFKLVNDTLGHHIGDGMLRTVARRLVQTVRSEDTVSRLGGDEFVIVMRHIGSREELDALVRQRLIPAIRMPMMVEGHSLTVSCSVGAALYPQDATHQDELMRRADAAMYEAKSAGRDTARYFSVETDQRVSARQVMENQLRSALDHQEFSLHFQPRLSARTRRLRGAEALLRWTNPVLGSVPPGDFIRLAEETGLIRSIGPWVLERACRQWADLAVADPSLEGLQLSVNLSAAQLADSQLIAQVQAALAGSGLSPRQLELELTESHLMDSPELAQQQLAALKALGVHVAIDDFGTGYSSLAYLKRFDIDKLKVDQSFVRGMLDDAADAAIVQAVIGLGHTLELKVVAEGVENLPTAQALTALGCDELQGYGFGRPMPPPDFLQWVRGWWGEHERRQSRRVLPQETLY
jgi:diguanylate cyclase (GGDEF)-like protein/PAS domain S-box-containing protein